MPGLNYGERLSPSWQVLGLVRLASTMLGAMLDIDVLGPFGGVPPRGGGVQQALVYSMKD